MEKTEIIQNENRSLDLQNSTERKQAKKLLSCRHMLFFMKKER